MFNRIYTSEVKFIEIENKNVIEVEKMLNNLNIRYDKWLSDKEVEIRIYVDPLKEPDFFKKFCDTFKIDFYDCEFAIFYANL